MIDLRSDTVTRPGKAMLEAMHSARVGDDVFAEDPTVKALEEKAAAMFGFEAGLFFPSGTMSNQVAIKAHTQPLDEIICDKLCHIYNYETGGWAFHSGVSIRLTNGPLGIMAPDDIEACILPDYDWYPNTRLVCIENSVNKGGGSIYTLDEMKAISAFCKSKNLPLHMDGARLFNALAAQNIAPVQLSGLFDTISICISKGLGAPVGSVLLGNRDLIKRSRKIRKVMGGGMRQAGYLAAACIYALDNNVDRLGEDHKNAQLLGTALAASKLVKHVLPVQTNLVIAEVENAQLYAGKLKEQGILAQPFSSAQIRFVTHLDVSNNDIQRVTEVIDTLKVN
jgi:threonine aldolase